MILSVQGRCVPQALKRGHVFKQLAARLKPRPFKTLHDPSFSAACQAIAFPRRSLFCPSRFLSSTLLLGALSMNGALCMAQNPSAAEMPETKSKADIIFEHGNIYTGVPANSQFSSILREEAIAVRGDRRCRSHETERGSDGREISRRTARSSR